MRLSSTALFFFSLLSVAISAPINDVMIEARVIEEVAREPTPLLKREAQGVALWKRAAETGSLVWRRDAEAGPPQWRREAEAEAAPGMRRAAQPAPPSAGW